MSDLVRVRLTNEIETKARSIVLIDFFEPANQSDERAFLSIRKARVQINVRHIIK